MHILSILNYAATIWCGSNWNLLQVYETLHFAPSRDVISWQDKSSNLPGERTRHHDISVILTQRPPSNASTQRFDIVRKSSKTYIKKYISDHPPMNISNYLQDIDIPIASGTKAIPHISPWKHHKRVWTQQSPRTTPTSNRCGLKDWMIYNFNHLVMSLENFP